MESCEQAPGLNMLQHGHRVHEKYIELLQELEARTAKCATLQDLYNRVKLPPPNVLRNYHIYHDCGKHLALVVDENGKRRFPNHAEISAKQFANVFPEDGFSACLISKDMDFHILKGDDLAELCKHPLAPILYFTAWAEINANAEMFGGFESDSYKIKAKRLIQAGKKLLNNKQGATNEL